MRNTLSKTIKDDQKISEKHFVKCNCDIFIKVSKSQRPVGGLGTVRG